MTTKTALVDLDSVVYAAGFSCQKTRYLVVDDEAGVPVADLGNCSKKEAQKEVDAMGTGFVLSSVVDAESESLATWTAREMVESILQDTEADDSLLYLTEGKSNYRLSIDSQYKANRKDLDRPVHYEAVRQYLVDEFGAEICRGIEADDQISIKGWEDWRFTKEFVTGHTVVICSIDKDLDTVPGYHYRWPTHNKAGAFYFVTEDNARHNFWVSVLTGDNADNIRGLHRIGPMRAESILTQCETDKDYYEACKAQYDAHDRLEDFHKNCQLLYLLRSEGDSFDQFLEREGILPELFEKETEKRSDS